MANSEKTRALLEDIKRGVTDLKSGDDWGRYLRMQARFHAYSFGNILLILTQRPDATRVAGFNTWKQLGRFVRKGESGIRILAPLLRKVRPEEGQGDDDSSQRVVGGFRVVHVFDVSQTDGEPLPQLTRRLSGRDEEATIVRLGLQQFAEDLLCIPVAYEPLEGMNGYLLNDPVSPRIVVGKDLAPLQQAKTLAHELGHAILHLGTDCHDRPQKEVEAESVAYVVMSSLGFDTSDYSLGYVAAWSSGDPETVTKSAQAIQRAAHRILDALEVDELETFAHAAAA